MQRVDPRYPGFEKITVVLPAYPPCKHPVVYVTNDKPAQHEEQVDGQVALVDSTRVTIGVYRR